MSFRISVMLSELSWGSKHCSSGSAKNSFQTVWPRPGSCWVISKNVTEQFFESLRLFVHQSSPGSVAMLVVYMRHEKRWGCRLGELGQIKYVGLFFLVGHPTQALQSHTEIWRLCKNALKAEACLLLWNETCSCCKMFWHKKKTKTNSTGDNLRGKKQHLR